MLRHATLIAVILAGGAASAGTVHGDIAEHLTFAVRYAGVAPAVKKTAYTFQVAAADCIRTLDAGGKPSEYGCTVGKAELKDAAAYLLYTALTDAGVPYKPVADTQIQVSAKGVSCTFDDSVKDYDKRFACTGDALRTKPVFEPLPPGSKPKVKDLVQPVKIEKQQLQ